jgi:1-acyl-sn-glycerol-3-phosphate acyltransferase
LARIAIEAGVPVIPVAMIGTYDIQPTGQVFPKIMRVGIAFGEPIDMSQYAGRQRDPAALREATNLVMDSLKNLGGQEYVDIYATKAKEILANPQADATDAENAADAEEN